MRKIGKCRDEKRKRFRDCGKQIKDENERPQKGDGKRKGSNDHDGIMDFTNDVAHNKEFLRFVARTLQ